MPFHLFYNDAVNQEVNLKEDYRRWKAGGADEFSFCEHAYVLEPASKTRRSCKDPFTRREDPPPPHPSAKAQAAPAHPRATPPQLGCLRWPSAARLRARAQS